MPLTELPTEQLYTRRWTETGPSNASYFYDEPIKDINKRPAEFPPVDTNLSDAWVVVVLKSTGREERAKNWDAVFTQRGVLRDTYVHKGQAAKLWDLEGKIFRYALVNGYHHMHGTEGPLETIADKHDTRCLDYAKLMIDLNLPEQFHHACVAERINDTIIQITPKPILRVDSGEVVLWAQSMTGGLLTVSMVSPLSSGN